MSAFQQALANANANAQAGPSVSIRGSANGAPGAGRELITTALRRAGINRDRNSGMEIDGAAGGSGGRKGAAPRTRAARPAGPIDQTGRHKPNTSPYGKSNDRDGGRNNHNNNNIPNRPGDGAVTRAGQTLAARMAHPGKKPSDHRRNPIGTPPILKQDQDELKRAQSAQHKKLNEKLNSEGMRNWLMGRVVAEGSLDMSGLPEDKWLQEQGLVPPGHREAPSNAGTVFWRLINKTLQQGKTPIHTISLANNNLYDLSQLSRLPFDLPYLRHLDLSNNPITKVSELDHLLSQGEKKGKATAGMGSLKSLIELKFIACAFREETLKRASGGDHYQHEILRRFPGLRILDGHNLNRIIFPLERKPKVKYTDEQKGTLSQQPFTYPMDVQQGFVDDEGVKTGVLNFCANFFPKFDNDRASIIYAYSPTATISYAANTLKALSFQQRAIERSMSSRPHPVLFTAWTGQNSRNFFRQATSIEARMRSLKSPTNQAELLEFWKEIPITKHPLEDSTKWCIDSWLAGGEGAKAKVCAMIQGEFQEMPSGTYRSFSRTFIITTADPASTAFQAGFQVEILSDILVVHSYLGTASHDANRSLAVHGVTINPIIPIAPTTAAAAAIPNLNPMEQQAMITQMREQTRMNAQFAELCLAQNGWNYEVALTDFERIKGDIPPEAFV